MAIFEEADLLRKNAISFASAASGIVQMPKAEFFLDLWIARRRNVAGL
ncbi:hypothetical protein PX699_05360 [Sphingobium sp. H39-3-25]|nr:hypothetical protein [Sphingobium arseniciresistens]